MKLLPVLSLLGCTLALGLSSTPLHAQSKPAPQTQLPPGAKRIPQRNFGVCFLLAPDLPELYFRDAKGDYQQLQIDRIRFDNWNVIPVETTLEIFKKIETPETRQIDPETKKVVVTPAKVNYLPVKTWELPPGTDSVRKLLYFDSAGKVMEHNFTTTAEGHGPFQARVINLLGIPVGIRFDNLKQIVAPGAEVTLTVTTAAMQPFQFQYGFERPDGTAFVAPKQNMRFQGSNERLTTIIGYIHVETFDADDKRTESYFRTESVDFIEEMDQLPKPPEPVIVYPSGKPAKGT